MDTTFYMIKDMERIGKIENRVPYIYDPITGWIEDQKSVLMDRVMGYDGDSIGNMSMLSKVDVISAETAETYLKSR